ncbi:MAG: hypothetical protein DRQ59_09275 [Gammaproteobacteria bacterium]|nr:MAG: hypothetical protein DRQ59_09275 [Gammaproteobacteria bacterium]
MAIIIDSSHPVAKDQYSAWSPGIESEIPAKYRLLETIYDSKNVSSNIDEISQLAKETGLSPEELVVFRPGRLALHELIVRVTADIVVLEGEHEEDLGIRFRRITHQIMDTYLVPHLPEFDLSFQNLYQQAQSMVDRELSQSLFVTVQNQQKSKPSILSRLFAPPKKQPRNLETTQERQLRVISSFKDRGLSTNDPFESAVYRSLYRVLGSIVSTRGYLGKDKEMLVELITTHICSRYGSRLIGKQVDAWVKQAVIDEGYSLIPDAQNPILISLKGSSAAGKSSLRPMLRQMMHELGIEEDGYGTISPDIWRRLLLDYDSLGEAYKYAGRLTSYEVIIIDAKLDHYIRAKAQHRKSTPHLVVDRFRFDSFASEKITRILHSTYARYVDTMYMYFVVTPPEDTVERGWERGQVRGRYKSVEDFLGHCIEAYAGMPKLLFKWLANNRPRFIFEFLDNSVARGCYPTMIARGTQAHMDIFDPIAFINIERYQKINVMARTADAVYPEQQVLEVANNIGFLQQCIRKIENVRFLDLESGLVYVTATSGKFRVTDVELFTSRLIDPDLSSIFLQLAPEICNITDSEASIGGYYE